ncbi:TolC family protein [Helicobacter magdeburgensis]|uniref:TolC family protein n=1 Tax=Helicobacter magdeburgensis TaxID=471858 RepID=A0A4U8T2F6_9HELI|nr:TolC family protein [Helicobacter magdeburgensis]TLD93494.1 TolC family protein [Helicobacter magdeburgensis]
MMRKSIVCIAFVFASQMFAEIQNDNFESEKVYRFEEIESTKDNLQIQGSSQTPTNKGETDKASGRLFTLAELLEGAKKNYNLEAKELAILQAQAVNRAAYGEFLPTLDGAYQYQDTDNPSMRLKAHTSSAKANWEIFSGFKTYNKVREKGSLYRASIEDKEHTKDQLFLNIIEQYYGYFTNRAQLLSLEQKRTQLESNIKRVERLYNAGLTTIDDVESLRAEVLATEHELANIKMEIEKNKFMLSLLSNTEVEALERKTIKTPLFKLDENRHDLNMLNFQAQSAKYQARQINYLPIVSVSDTYVINSDITKNGSLAFKDLPLGMSANDMLPMIQRSFPLNQNQIMISATIHLDALTIYRQNEAARLGYMKSLKELAYKKEEQKKDERMYRKSLEIAVAKIKASEAALRSANIAFDNVAKKYDAQILNFTDYLQSLTKKVEAEATYNQALNNYEMQKAYYIYYSGQDLAQHIE